MQKKLARIGLGVMIIIALSGCGKENKINEYDKENEINVLNNIEVVEIERYKNESNIENGELSVDIAVFELKNLSNKVLQDELNNKFKKRANDKINECKEFIKQEEGENDILSRPYGAIETFDYSIVRNDDKIFTLCVFEQSGRLQTKDYYNIDKTTGALIKLEDIYGEHENYLDYIADYIAKKCENRNKTEKLYDLATFENIRDSSHLNNFYIKENGKVVISFYKYMISVGAAGIVEFELGDDLDFSKKLETYEESKEDKPQSGNGENDNKQIIKVTKDDILEHYNESQYTLDYSNLCQQLKNTFYYSGGVAIQPGAIYQIDLNGDGIAEEVQIRDDNLYIGNYICKPYNEYLCSWGGCFITDLDRQDKNLEVVLQTHTEIGCDYIFSYDGKTVKYLGEVWGAEVDGFGNVVAYGEQVMGINYILTSYYKLTENGLKKQDIEYDKNVEHTAGKLIFSENINEIKQCIDYIGEEGEKFKAYRENAEVLEEGTIFNLLDVYGEDGYHAIPFVKLQDGREGYVMDYYAVEDVMRYK